MKNFPLYPTRGIKRPEPPRLSIKRHFCGSYATWRAWIYRSRHFDVDRIRIVTEYISLEVLFTEEILTNEMNLFNVYNSLLCKVGASDFDSKNGHADRTVEVTLGKAYMIQ